MAQFNYEPLKSSRAIRLLRFLPGPEPICQMITVEVEKAPPYLALSYTWGCNKHSRLIRVNGFEMPVTANLGDAIDVIFIFARQQNMMFWADSICINQANVDERSHQVRLMNTIYRSAEIVAIWLGTTADESDLAFDMMKEWKARLDVLREQCGGSDELAVTSISSNDPLFFGPRGSKERRALEALRKIGHRLWWTRAWIVQEGTIAHPSRTILFCGNRSIDWACLRAALQITHHAVHYQSSGMSVDFNDGMTIRLDEFRKDREAGANVQLLRILRLMRAYRCEDPRDKVYAALGMAMDVNEDDIIPDYRKPYSEVYTDVVRFFISELNSRPLDFLGEIVRSAPGTTFEHQHDSSLPSWVPDWTFRVSMHPFEKVLDPDAYGEISKAYNASGMLTGNCYIDDRALRVQGSVLDQITQLSNICEWNLATRGLETERSWAPEHPNSPYFNGETIMEAYNHTLAADIGRQNMDSDSKLSRGFAIDWELVEREVAHMTPAERRRKSWMLVDVKMMAFGRRLFRTSRGFMGLGPAAAQVGDRICVLLGGQVLYVLRHLKDSHFELVGECYVHGMMDGQACEDGGFSNQEIILV
jgi:hypothetical protein